MTNRLLTLLHKPDIWQRSTQPFWDDGHISKGMLEAHLNPNINAASRKHDFIDKSVAWLSSIVPEGSKILDLGCGPGLYTKRLANLGYDVTGIDYSKRSIAYAQSQDSKTKYIYASYLDIDYFEEFDLIILIYCDYGALIPSEQEHLLKKIYKALKPNGRFIFDVFSSACYLKRTESKTWSFHKDGGYWSPRQYACLNAEYKYENNRAIVSQHVVVDNKTINEYLLWDRFYTRETLEAEVSSFGFKLINLFGNACGLDFSDDSETLCAVIEK